MDVKYKNIGSFFGLRKILSTIAIYTAAIEVPIYTWKIHSQHQTLSWCIGRALDSHQKVPGSIPGLAVFLEKKISEH